MEHPIQNVLAKLSAAEWIPVTAARILTGVFFGISGGTKLLVPAQFSRMQQTMIESHIPFPHASALFVSLVEFVCGGGLIFGLLTPFCALMLMGDMIVAILANRIGSIHASGFLAFLDEFLYLPEFLYVLILFWLLFSGPGPYSVDRMMVRWGGSPASTGHQLAEETARKSTRSAGLWERASLQVGISPQLAGLVHTHRAEGMSGWCYLLWAVASGLLLVHAMGMRSVAFTVVLIAQILGCVLIATMATTAVRVARQHAAERAGLS